MINSKVRDVVHGRRDLVGNGEVNEAVVAFSYFDGEFFGMCSEVSSGDFAIGSKS